MNIKSFVSILHLLAISSVEMLNGYSLFLLCRNALYISLLERVFSLRRHCAQINDAVRSASYPLGSGELISFSKETAHLTTHIYLVTRLRIPRGLPPQTSCQNVAYGTGCWSGTWVPKFLKNTLVILAAGKLKLDVK